MKTTVSTNACPKCGAPVPAEAPQSLCPKCVLAQAALGNDPGHSPTATSQIPSLERLAVAFPQLQVLELIGRGGMGFVFKARQPHLDRFVALKLLPDSLARDPQFTERFNREGRVLARLNHPNIVSVFDFGHAGGFYYLMMEYVDGVNLRQAMQAGRFSPSEALAIVPKICEALQFAHDEGILHRDIKPENILLDSKGRVKIADFGIAKLVGEDKPDISLTATGAAIGTMHYMAPEQLEKPGTVDHRADIYSLGVVFYELLTGELPLGRFGPPSAKTPVDSRVDDVVMRTLEREREKRFQSAGEMGTTVEHLTEIGAGKTAPTFSPAEDFILCPPRLPRMAKNIIVYALVLAPLFWFLGLFIIEPLPENALVKFAQGALNVLIVGVEFLVLIVFAIGAWKLRALRTSAVGWLKTAFWAHLALTVVAIAGQIYVEVLTDQLIPNTPAKHLGLAEGAVIAVVLATLIFEISALVWLKRHGAALKAICAQAAAGTGPGGTKVLQAGGAQLSVPAWSQKAIWGSVLVALSLPLPVFIFLNVYSRAEIFLMLEVAFLPVFAGTLLGWMALSDIRAHQGRLRGLPFCVFAALTWPLIILLAFTSTLPAYVFVGSTGMKPLFSLLLIAPAGALTFAIWAVYEAASWGGNKPKSLRRGVLKWIFLVLLLSAGGIIMMPRLAGTNQNAAMPQAAVATDTNATPWIRFTFTAVELREVKGVRWLAIDYLDDVHGECQKSFPWETTIPGFKPATRTSEFLGGDTNSPVRHQRIEYRMPDSAPHDQLERLRDNLETALKHKSFRLELGENEVPLLLFELPGVEGGSLKARIKVVPPLNTAADSKSPANARKFELRIPTITDDPYKSVGVTTDSELPVGDYLVGLLQRPDGRVEEKPAVVTIYKGSGRTGARVMQHILWPMGLFESNLVREIVSDMRATLDGRLIELVPDGRSRVFRAKNDQGAVTEGFIALRSQKLSATNLPPVTVSIAEVPQSWGPFLSVKIRVSAPSGYYPNAVGLLSDGSELETSTSIMGGGRGSAWSGDSCLWYFPGEFQGSDVQDIVRQLESTKVSSPNGIAIPPGQRVPMFSVTNKTGTIFRGYFELHMTNETK